MPLLAAACSGGSSGSTATSAPASSTSSIPTATTLPASGTVRFTDGRVYTVAAPGSALALDDIRVRLGSLHWTPVTNSATLPPGMHTLGVVTLRVSNLGGSARTVVPTQFWLLDAGRQEFLAQAGTHVAGGLIGMHIPPGATRTGTLVFTTPRRFSTGTVLVYRFADAAAIAHAKHVGLLRFG